MKPLYYLCIFFISSLLCLSLSYAVPVPLKKIPLQVILPKSLPKKSIAKNASKKEKKKKRKTVGFQSFKLQNFENSPVKIAKINKAPLVFDLPITYNHSVKKWIRYFQGSGRKWFRIWLERSHRYIPLIQKTLIKKKLPTDLAYLAMIESGFSTHATSSASAVGPWQFIASTGKQYGLRSNWWLDERRDFEKSTVSASNYLTYLYSLFKSWHLAAAAYNMGENRLKGLIRKYKTKDFWQLSQKRSFARETKDYIPKLIAATLIAKSPKLYGFRNIQKQYPLEFDYINVPGGIDVINLSDSLGVTRKFMKSLNPELKQNFIPRFVKTHRIRIPVNSRRDVLKYIQKEQGIILSKKKSNRRKR